VRGAGQRPQATAPPVLSFLDTFGTTRPRRERCASDHERRMVAADGRGDRGAPCRKGSQAHSARQAAPVGRPGCGLHRHVRERFRGLVPCSGTGPTRAHRARGGMRRRDTRDHLRRLWPKARTAFGVRRSPAVRAMQGVRGRQETYGVPPRAGSDGRCRREAWVAQGVEPLERETSLANDAALSESVDSATHPLRSAGVGALPAPAQQALAGSQGQVSRILQSPRVDDR